MNEIWTNTVCLEKIFQHLPIKDRLRFEAVSKSFKSAAQRPWRNLGELNIHSLIRKDLTIEQFRRILFRCHPKEILSLIVPSPCLNLTYDYPDSGYPKDEILTVLEDFVTEKGAMTNLHTLKIGYSFVYASDVIRLKNVLESHLMLKILRFGMDLCALEDSRKEAAKSFNASSSPKELEFEESVLRQFFENQLWTELEEITISGHNIPYYWLGFHEWAPKIRSLNARSTKQIEQIHRPSHIRTFGELGMMKLDELRLENIHAGTTNGAEIVRYIGAFSEQNIIFHSLKRLHIDQEVSASALDEFAKFPHLIELKCKGFIFGGPEWLSIFLRYEVALERLEALEVPLKSEPELFILVGSMCKNLRRLNLYGDYYFHDWDSERREQEIRKMLERIEERGGLLEIRMNLFHRDGLALDFIDLPSNVTVTEYKPLFDWSLGSDPSS